MLVAAGFVVVSLVIIALRPRLPAGEVVATAVIERSSSAIIHLPKPRTDARLSLEAAGLPPVNSSGADAETASGVKVLRQNGGQVPGAKVIRVPDNNAVVLVGAPDARVTDRSQFGPMPRISNDGLTPRDVYARPYAPGGKPAIAIVMTGVGIGAKGTADAITRLPGEVTLAFAPYGRDLEAQTARARREGHEILLQVPMEPFDFPDSDPGPHTLRTGAAARDNMERLHWMMSRFSGYVGLTNFMGGKLMANSDAYGPVLEELSRRGLLFLDDGTARQSQTSKLAGALKLPARRADRMFDGGAASPMLASLLADAEKIAQAQGGAIVSVPAVSANIEILATWIDDMRRRGLELAPVSALMRKPQ